jgi:predicted kinase
MELRCALDPAQRDRRIARRRQRGDDASDADALIAARVADAFDDWPEASPVHTGAARDLVVAQVESAVQRWIGGPDRPGGAGAGGPLPLAAARWWLETPVP